MAASRYPALSRRHFLWVIGVLAGGRFCPALAADGAAVAPQAYFAGVNRAIAALDKLGSPIAAEEARRISVLTKQNNQEAIEETERILGRYTLANLTLNADGSGEVAVGAAERTLVEQGWRMFLVRVANPAGRADSIIFTTGGLRPWYYGGPGNFMPYAHNAARAGIFDTVMNGPKLEEMWLMTVLHDPTPIIRRRIEIPAVQLSGFPIEYRVIQLFSREGGAHRAELALTTFTKSDIGPSVPRSFDFNCLPSRVVTLGVLDADGQSCVASLTIKDSLDRVYPPQVMRIAPDLSFQPQIYRGHQETLRLPDGEYTVVSARGPEYIRKLQKATIDGSHSQIAIQLERWIDPAKWGWYSGDTHIHAAGCAHYNWPTEGVAPETMIRQVRGEGLSIGGILSWGPSWYYQKQFFTGQSESPAATLEQPELQKSSGVTWQPHATAKDAESLLRYDVEVSGFPSSHCGHLVLLRLKDQDYPGAKIIENWPSWNLPILQWARTQGAVIGYAHCGAGMVTDSTELPNYEIPPMDGVGTEEAIVDVTHGAVDFLSGCDTQPVAELNAWYHLLNCGYRLAMLGETDYPCLSGARPGGGRSYVRLEHRPVDDSGYEAWIRGVKDGRLYCGDGRAHVLDFKVAGGRSGEKDVSLKGAETLAVEALVAARLEPEPPTEPKLGNARRKSWHLENARLGDGHEVAVELVVNGIAVDQQILIADGTPRAINFRVSMVRSSWVCLRIFPSVHTHPVFVTVDERPIRASKRSAQWCRACVDKLWEVKAPFMRESERPAAALAFEHSRKTYDAIAAQCDVA